MRVSPSPETARTRSDGGIVDDAVGVGQRGDLAEGGVGFEVEDDDGAAAAAVGDEAAAGLGDDGYAVGDLLAGNVAEGFAGDGVDDQGVGAAGDEEAMAGGVDGEVVPSAFAADVEGVGDLPVSLGDGGQRGCEEE